ncbi:MAG: serine/threonine-protein kinase [Deltaproteobacteria bacterium]|nr:serine/threonine-protein kinase [Deltaproteobacteria bacterium]
MSGDVTNETQTRSIGGPLRGPAERIPDAMRREATGNPRYAVLEEVGIGGMGRVLRAYDTKLRREVALKELRRHALTEGAEHRLLIEAQAMATLNHPNVVAIYDVEPWHSAGVVLVMEYVPGQTLRRLLKHRRRSWTVIARWFVAAGRGLAAAHDAGLLHRDFKPSNVLVSGADSADEGQWVIKVTDFGIAKSYTDQDSSSGGARTPVGDSSVVLTQDGTVLGTPQYMAPEQHRGDALTPAADQYAFCVALWEALCGSPPFAGDTVEVQEAKEQGPPRWPEPQVPVRIVEAVQRGLQPHPEDRWPSMTALLDVLGDNPGRRRARWLMVAAGVSALGLGAAWGPLHSEAPDQRCQQARQLLDGVWDDQRRGEVEAMFAATGKTFAHDVWSRTERELDHYTDDWVQMHNAACEATTIRGTQSAHMLDLQTACLRRASLVLGATVDMLADADASVVQRAHGLTSALRPLDRCMDAEMLEAEVEPPRPEEAEDVHNVRSTLAQLQILRKAGRLQAAEAALEDVLVAAKRVEYGPLQTEVRIQEGLLLAALGQFESSDVALNEALELGAAWGQRDLMRRAALSLMFTVGYQMGRPEQGRRYWSLARGLSEGDPILEARVRGNRAILLFAEGKFAEAEAENRAVLRLKTEGLGPDHLSLAKTHNNLAEVLYRLGRHEQAEAQSRTAIALISKALGPNHPKLATSRNGLAAYVQAQGRNEEAESLWREVLASREEVLGAEHPQVATVRLNLASLLETQGRFEEAEPEVRNALSIIESTLGSSHPDFARARFTLGHILSGQNEAAAAEAEFRAALSQMEQALGSEHPDTTKGYCIVSDFLLERSRIAEALPFTEQCWAARDDRELSLNRRADAAFVLARALWQVEGPLRDRRRARKLGREALRLHRAAAEPSEEAIERVRQWLHER